MTHTAIGFCTAVALGLAVTVGAQNPATTTSGASERETSVSGCLTRGTDGNYLLTNARIEPADAATTTAGAAGSTATTTAGTTGATTTTGTTGATTTAGAASSPASGAMKSGATWALSGGSDLDKHVGHRIQVTGRASGKMSGDAPSATTGGAATTTASTTTSAATTTASGDQPKLEVKSIKMIAASCS